MPQTEKSAVDQRLQNGVYGTPKINPDEQRRYLGTFRERVCLTISVHQLQTNDWTKALEQELAKKIGTMIFFNGNLSDDDLRPYMRVAMKAKAHFTLKNDPEFKTDADHLAIVVATKEAVYQSPVDVQKRYPNLLQITATTNQTKAPSFWQRIFHLKPKEE